MIDPEGLDGVESVIQAIAIVMLLFLVVNVIVVVAVLGWAKRTGRPQRGLVLVLTTAALVSVEASSVIAYLMLTGDDQEGGWRNALVLTTVAGAAAGAVAKLPKDASS